MKKIFLAIAAIAAFVSAKAAPGDTIKVQSHNKVHMNWYGDFDRKAKFPDASKTFNRVWMHYTLGCPSKGCSEWDYTTQVFARKRTGLYDSTLQQAPSFRVNGAIKDTLYYKNTVTYKYTFNTNTKQTDSVAQDTLKISLYGDPNKPLLVTSTVNAWPGNFYKPIFDTAGVKKDSVLIGFDAMLVRTNRSYYNVFEIVENYELGRVITPYNGGVPVSWNYTYTFDVTDFISLLRDSVEIRASYGGYQDGFTITLDFEFIEGTPACECYKVVSLWQGSSDYGNVNNSIENFLKERTVAIDAQMKQAKLRIIQTGHGFGGSDGCSEFCEKDHFININGTTRFQKRIWRNNCGLNPIFPQGGTWIYNRSNWCPGAEVDAYDYEVTPYVSAGASAKIDMDMEPYINQGNNYSSYIISGMLFLYKDNNFVTDASVEEVMAPNNSLRYARFNPVCDYPQVKIKNNGKDSIKSIEFSYGPKGGTRVTYVWQGSIAPQGFAEIKMGNNINYTVSTATNVFEMEITKVNGNVDGVLHNNIKRTLYDATPVYPARFVIWLRTNNRGSETMYTVKNHLGTTVYSKGGLANATSYRDTLDLPNGCYTFEILDNQGDGLGFWADPAAGSGQLMFRRADNGAMIKNHGIDFGTSIVESFTVGFALEVDKVITQNKINVFPNPFTGEFWLDLELVNSPTAQVTVYDLNGRLVMNETISQQAYTAHKIDLSQQQKGIYILKIQSADGVFTQKLIKE